MNRFKKIYIEITNVCNLSCEFCPKTVRSPSFMSPSSFCSVLERIHGWTGHLCFHVMGEPLLHPNISELLDISASQGFKVNLTTNGTLLQNTADSIIDKPALRQVSISLHSFEANTCKYAFDEYIDGVIGFTKDAMDKGRLIISLRLWNTSTDGKNERNEHVVGRIGKAFRPGLSMDEVSKDHRGVKLAENLYLNTAPVFQWPGLYKEDFGGEGFCRGLRDQAAILVDGTVVPCCLDSEGTIGLGNIFGQSFEEIIGGVKAQTIYEGFSERKVLEPLCRNCGYRTRFSHPHSFV